MADDLPIACTLDGRDLAGRQSELRDSVLAEAESVERLPVGYRWHFRGSRDLLGRLGAVIDAERHCCRFLRFALDVQPDLAAVTVEITGPEGTADFLESWIAPAPPS
jgi:hypothetical protein